MTMRFLGNDNDNDKYRLASSSLVSLMDIALISAPTGKVLQQPSKRNQQARENRAILQPLAAECETLPNSQVPPVG